MSTASTWVATLAGVATMILLVWIAIAWMLAYSD
jgi:hypothetical protein